MIIYIYVYANIWWCMMRYDDICHNIWASPNSYYHIYDHIFLYIIMYIIIYIIIYAIIYHHTSSYISTYMYVYYRISVQAVLLCKDALWLAERTYAPGSWFQDVALIRSTTYTHWTNCHSVHCLCHNSKTGLELLELIIVSSTTIQYRFVNPYPFWL